MHVGLINIMSISTAYYPLSAEKALHYNIMGQNDGFVIGVCDTHDSQTYFRSVNYRLILAIVITMTNDVHFYL